MLEIRSLFKSSGEAEVTLARVPVPDVKDDEILVRVDASPVNPSDLMTLFGPADLSKIKATGSGDEAKLTAPIPHAALASVAARLDQPLTVGNEAAGVVVKAGSKPEAQTLLGKNVAIFGGSMYTEYRVIKAADALLLPDGVTAVDGAAAFINPLTVLYMIETMKHEGHKGIVHSAAASNLGQMLVKLCLKDDVPLVNIVRSESQVQLLRSLGAKHVVDSSSKSFFDDLVHALVETGATLAFDAVWGGKLAGQILMAMDAAILKRNSHPYSPYGTPVWKQVYIYGALDPTPIELPQYFGFHWGVAGWLVFAWMTKLGADTTARARARIASEITTTFASKYEGILSLHEALQLHHFQTYSEKTTGKKYLISPSKK